MLSQSLDSFTFNDLNMVRKKVTRFSSAGTPYESWVAVGMPRVPSNYLDSVCYLYNSEDDAKKGVNFGGTGFLVSYPSITPGQVFLYIVTNWHVACRDGASCVRINKIDGTHDIFPYEPHEWEFDPRYDIAVKLISLPSKSHKVTYISVKGFAHPRHMNSEHVSIGDDVFMIGRFVDHDGGSVNRPSLRFGNISVMPFPIEQPNGKKADTFCVDLHCRSGYSGSPVFVYRTPGSDLSDFPEDLVGEQVLIAGRHYLGLLGILYGQFPEEWEIKQKKTSKSRIATSTGLPLNVDGAYIAGLSGMSCVLPAWSILEVLDMAVLKNERDEANSKLASENKASGKPVPVPMAASSVDSSNDENPNHRGDFTSLLTAAAKTPLQGG